LLLYIHSIIALLNCKHKVRDKKQKTKMKTFSIASWLLLLCAITVQVTAQTTVDQLGQSGKFRISDGSGDKDDNRITVEVDFVQEEPSSSTDHGTQTVANQDFTITSVGDTTIQGVGAFLTQFKTTLVTSGTKTTYGTLRMDFYRFTQAGTITTGTESWDVANNDVKINLYLDNWSFDTSSTFVDVGVIIKGRKDTASESGSNKFNLGSNVPLLLSGRVSIDGVEKDMATGYPTYRQTGNKASFVFRFDKFSGFASYDPIIGYSSACATACDLALQYISNAFTSVKSFVGF